MITRSPTDVLSYTLRPMRAGDLPAVYALVQGVATALPDSYAPTLEDMQRDFDDPWWDPEADSRLALTAEGLVAGRAGLIANPEPAGQVQAWLDFDFHLAYRTDALVEPLFDWLVARSTERVRAIAAAHPGRGPLILRLNALETDRDLVDRARRQGFRPARYYYRMRRDLRQPIPVRPVPAGLALCGYSAALDERIRQAHNEAFHDNWGHEPLSADNWRQFLVELSTFRPDLSFAVLDGEEVAAYSMSRFDSPKAERTGFRSGWIGQLGTRAPWRGRGLASALLVASMRAFAAAQLEYAELSVDSENDTGALGLYERLGFVRYLTITVFHKLVEA